MRLALFQPDIPQNLGAAIRLCACLGVELDIVEPCAFPLDDRAIRRVALDYGSLARVKRHISWTAFRETLGAEARLVLLTTRGDVRLPDFEFNIDDVVLAGAESAGAPDFVHDAAHGRIRVPTIPGARSLNVITAATLALGEALRQTGTYP